MVIVSTKAFLGLPADAVAVFEEMADARKETHRHMEYWGYELKGKICDREFYELCDENGEVMERVRVAYTETAGGTFFQLADIGVE